MRAQRFLSILAVLLLAPLTFAAAQAPIIAGYVFPQESILQPGQIDPHSISRANYAFANIKDGRIVTGFPHDAENYAYLVALKKQNPSFTVLVSVGGWLWSGGFSDVALTAKSRTTFVDSVMDFIARYDLDGLDIDWEYPGLEGSTKNFRPQDGANFVSLLAELRERFDKQEKKTHRRLYLSIAAGSGEDYLAKTDMKQVVPYLDTVNLMAYDYVEPGDEKLTGHHAPLYSNPADTRNFSADISVHNFLKAGVPANKLILGVPFYGHTWGSVANVNHGYLQAGKPVPNAYANYGVIAAQMLNPQLPNQGYVRYWDPIAIAPYLYNADKQLYISYEDPESLAAKCRYVLDNKLAGVMFWEYSGDPTGALLSTLNRDLHEPAPRPDKTH